MQELSQQAASGDEPAKETISELAQLRERLRINNR
jgi:hypothetical protein